MKKRESRDAKVIHFFPNSYFYFERGIAAFREEKIKEAIEYLERAHELEPREPVVMCQLAICYTEVGQFHKSNQFLRYILENLDESMVYCYYFIANNFAYMKDFRRALQYAKRYQELDPTGEYKEEAEDLIQLLLEETPIGVALENNFAKAEQEFYQYKRELNRYLAEEDSASACQVLEKVIDEKPNFWPAYNQLAMLYFEDLREEEGLKVLYRLLDRSPGNLLGLADLFVYHYFKANREEAEKLYGELKKVVPILTHHKERLAVLHAMMADYTQAENLFVDIVDLEVTDRPRFYYYRAKTAFYLGQEENAKEYWQQFLNCDVYEREAFPFSRKGEMAHEASQILTELCAEDELDHFIGVYALSISSVRAELLLFNPLFEMSNWNYLEHLVFTDFEYLPEGILERNSKTLIQIWRKLEEEALPLAAKNLSFYKESLAAIFRLSEAEVTLDEEQLQGISAYLLVHFGGKQVSEATQICGAQPLELPFL